MGSTPPKMPALPVTDEEMKARLIRDPKLPFLDEKAAKSLTPKRPWYWPA